MRLPAVVPVALMCARMALAQDSVAVARNDTATAVVAAGNIAAYASVAQRHRRFYASRPYGSERQFNPLSEILNEGYDILRVGDRTRHVFRDVPYSPNFRMILRTLGNPVATYREYGFRRALRNEILPLSSRSADGGGAWLPNYEFHLLGSGMVSVRVEEWAEQHDIPHPLVVSAITMGAAHLLNETVENGGSRYSEDALTDLAVFDVLGFMMFRADRVQRAFSGAVELTNWPGQISYVASTGTVENLGQQFILRAPLPRTDKLRFFTAFGISNIVGLSYGARRGLNVSVGGGAEVVDLPLVDASTGARTTRLAPSWGLFADREGSLLASALSTGNVDAVAMFNLYPGVVSVAGVSPGLWLHVLKDGRLRFGMASPLGIGIGRNPQPR